MFNLMGYIPLGCGSFRNKSLAVRRIVLYFGTATYFGRFRQSSGCRLHTAQYMILCSIVYFFVKFICLIIVGNIVCFWHYSP